MGLSVSLTGVYFALLNLPRLLEMPVNLRLLLEIALPLIAPLVVIWCAFRFATHMLLRD